MKFDKYIGLPYKDNGRDVTGIDCWGLVRLYYKDEFGIELPSYAEEYDGPFDSNVSRAISLYKDNWETTTTPSIGDVTLFNIYGEPAHVGIYVGNNKFLHSREGKDSVIESLGNIQWNKRLVGIYKYTKQTQVETIGAPHPLKTNVYKDWTVAGTTVEDFVKFATEKYKVSTRLASKLMVVIDGVAIPKDKWSTTVIQAGQIVAYRAVPEGGNDTFRMFLMVAIAIAAPYLATTGFTAFGVAVPGLGLAAGSFGAIAASAAITITGMALINAIMPVRPPTQNDPGSPGALNLFTGTSNQANKFGAIPVVLGKVRITGALGASPYIETLTDTSLLNLLIVWGFGPLSISDICIGGNAIENYYTGLPLDTPRPVTLYGRAEEDTNSFDKLYGADVEQAPAQNVELVNNPTDGNPWKYVTFTQESTRVDVSFACPEGMRTVSTKDGSVSAATAGVEIQLGTYNSTTGTFDYADTAAFSLGDYTAASRDTAAFSTMLEPPYYSNGHGIYTSLYRFTIIAMAPGGGVSRFDGAATDSQNAEPSAALVAMYRAGSYAGLVGSDVTYKRLPQLPPGYQKLYTICTHGTDGVVSQESHLNTYSTHIGLELTVTPITEDYFDGTSIATGSVKISVAAGTINNENASAAVTVNAQPEEIFNSRQFAIEAGSNVTPVTNRVWGTFLNTFGIAGVTDTLNITKSVYFPYSGYYSIEASADDEGEVYIGGIKVLNMPSGGAGYTKTVTSTQYYDQGTHTVNLRGTNSGGGARGAGVQITYIKSGINSLATTHTEIIFGTNGFFEKRKDAFGFCQKFMNLPKKRYSIRCRRTNDDQADSVADYHKYSKVVLFTAACFDNTKPTVNPPNCYLAKTAIRVQSTNKANGNVDGVNAMVQSIAWDWDKDTQKWITRPTNNPASLFAYVLMHPGNAYKITNEEVENKIDLDSLKEWHEFCEGSNPSGKPLAYNNIITGSMSVMDVLRDICATGMASPLFINGKWSIVIDKPRTYTAQHFTNYNSWGFESTKALPRLPHAFRVTIPDESIAYQPSEYIIYNYGYSANGGGGKTKATLFETLSLPGVTNADQAKFLAKWNLAQLKLRPEVYTINTDFEYLVCTRGDVVKVTHDVPQWGLSSGRLKTATTGATTLSISEPVYLTAGKSYQILIRTNNKSSPNGITKNLTTISQSGWFDTLTLSTAITAGDGLEVDNLYMLGEATTLTQQLVVISIEPTSSTGAKLTLVDYAPAIYTTNLDELLTFDANITTSSFPLVQNTITGVPIIGQMTSSSALSEQISGGTYQNVLIVSFSNPTELTNSAQVIEAQVVLGDSDFGSTSLTSLYKVDKSVSSLTINGLTTATIYKIRARYTNQSGDTVGPWSTPVYFTNLGKTINSIQSPVLTMDMDNTTVIAYPISVAKPSTFKYYEYRIYKDTGTEDFWELPVNESTYNIQVMTSSNEGRFDLTKQPLPRISAAGITYRVACRVVDTTGNYSPTSTLGTIVVTTIQ